jgi:hypothetical protein
MQLSWDFFAVEIETVAGSASYDLWFMTERTCDWRPVQDLAEFLIHYILKIRAAALYANIRQNVSGLAGSNRLYNILKEIAKYVSRRKTPQIMSDYKRRVGDAVQTKLGKFWADSSLIW